MSGYSRNSRTFLACLITNLMFLGQLAPMIRVNASPTTDVKKTATEKMSPAAEALAAPIPSSVPAPAAGPLGVNIIATNFDSYPNSPGPAQPGEVITYNIHVVNNGDTDATGVTLNDIIDANTTLIPGSLQTQPIATPDSYNVIGNVRIQPNAAQGLLANDLDPDTGNNNGLTASGPTFSAQGGNVVVNPDGSFSYNPNPGVTGPDEFTYTVTDQSGKTDTAKVSLNIGLGDVPGSTVIWFINSTAPPGGDGRLTSPFNCYNGTNSPTQTCFSATAADDVGDIIFLYSGNYTGGNTLLDQQALVGQGASSDLETIASLGFAPGSDPLPETRGTRPIITTTIPNTNAINLGRNNQLRGVTVGDTTGAKIVGDNFGILRVGFLSGPDVTLTGFGKALNLSNGEFHSLSAFESITTTSSPSQGVSLIGITGTARFGSTTVSGQTSDCILVNSTTADINFGNTTCTGGPTGLHFEKNPSGTRTFGNLSVSAGSNAFLHLFDGPTGIGGGNVTVTGAATLTGGTDAMLVNTSLSNPPLIDFQAATSVTSTGTTQSDDAISWIGQGTLNFGALSLQTNNGIGLNAQGGATITVANNTGTINAKQAIRAISLTLNAKFASVNAGGNIQGISLSSVTGTCDFGSGTLVGSTTGEALSVGGGSVNVTFTGNMLQTNNRPLLSVSNHSGTITFDTGTLSATNGTGLQFTNADGVYSFNGTTTLNGADAGIDILADSAGTFTFGPGTTITNPTGHAFNVDGQTTTSTAAVIYSGNITTTNPNPTQPPNIVRIWNHANSPITFQTGTVHSTVPGMLFFNADGIYNFNGTTTLTNTFSGIHIENGSDGTFNLNNTTITNSGSTLWVSGAPGTPVTGDISISGPLTKNDFGTLVQIGGYNGGTINISSPLTCNACSGIEIGSTGNGSVINFTGATKTFNLTSPFTNQGFRFVGNAGSTINFVGGNLNITSTGRRTAWDIRNGGTITVQGSNNTISASQGTALRVENVDIGAAGMTFQSISSVGNIGDDFTINTGLILNNTGSLGSLRVTGNGGPGTGGTIANKTGANGLTANGVGIYLSNTKDVQLNWMQLNDFQNFAIQANDLDGFSLQNSTVNGLNGNDVDMDEGSISIANSTGVINIANSTISGGLEDNLRILYDSTTPDTATYNFTSNTFSDLQSGNIALVNLRSTSTASPSSNVTFNFGSPADPLLGNAFDNGANQNPLPPPATQWFARGILANFEGPFQHTLNIDRNSFNKLGQALGLNSNFGADVDYRVFENNLTSSEADTIAMRTGSSSTASSLIQALIQGNDIGNGSVDSGSRLGFGISGVWAGEEIARITIHQNVIRNTELSGILLFGQAGDGDVHQRITNNTVSRADNLSASVPGIDITTDNASSHDTFLDMRNNDLTGNIARDIRLRQANLNNTFSLEDLPSSTPVTVDTTVESFLVTLNPGNTVDVLTSGSVVSYTTMDLNNTNTPLPLSSLLSTTKSIEREIAPLTQVQLDLLSAAARERWTAMGLTAEQINVLRNITFEIADLSTGQLAVLDHNRVRIDRDANGYGWFVDATPMDDSEFVANLFGIGLFTSTADAPDDRIDLLTAIMHEMGHRLGLSDSSLYLTSDDLMLGYLPNGERRLPNARQIRSAILHEHDGPSYLHYISRNSGSLTATIFPSGPPPITPIIIGTLRTGDSVTITLQVMVNNPYLGGPTVSNQGSVSGTNFAAVLTDDLQFPGTADPTVTPVNDIRNIRVNDSQVSEPTTTSTTMLFTVALSAPAGSSGGSVHMSTVDQAPGSGHAVAGTDYDALPDTLLTFTSGEQFKTIGVNILSDVDSAEPDETFIFNLSNPVGVNITDAQAIGTIKQGNASGTFLISELRSSGPAGPGDDFVELYNNTDSPLTIAASDNSNGYGLFKMGADCNAIPVLIGTIPNGTVIPARGHYLMVGLSYSLDASAAGDLTMSEDIDTDANVAVFNTADVGSLSTVTRLDAVGFGDNVGAICDLLREGTNLGSLSGHTLEYSFHRDRCGKGGSTTWLGNCPSNGLPVDANNNSKDFLFANTTGQLTLAGQRLGAPGPENLASPIVRNNIPITILDPLVPASVAPNRVRNLTPDPQNNATFGTMSIRRTITNNTGGPITRLRFRVIDITGFPSQGMADVRALTSSDVTVTVTGGGIVNVTGTTLDSPLQQPGGGFNSTLSVGTITLATPLANGANVSVQFLLGIQQTGTFKFFVNLEALP